MVESNKAVFLSYAKQDARAAERICAALRAGGIEVWFDQSELRGGDAWDAAIRKQIKTCALMIPIISANTQGRAEGYFRLEWKLAVDRSHLMSQDRTFLLPVVIDETREDDERVPERFREVQWTRLPEGETSAAFVTRILRLLEQDPAASPGSIAQPTPAPASVPPPVLNPAAAAAAAPPNFARKPRSPLLWGGVAALIAMIAFAAWATRHTWLRPPAVIAYSNEDRRMTYALLPFHAPADDAHGVQIAKATGDEILTMLETRKELVSVAPRGSVEQAVAHEVSMKKLARALDVHFLIRGSVARAGDNYTVTVLGVDGDSERVLETQTLTVAAAASTPRWRNDVAEAMYHLIRAGLQAEVKRARDKPIEALDARDLSFRAAVDWRAHRDADGKAANANANELLSKALSLAPDDLYALRETAIINLCDCVNAWSPNPDEQKAVGAAAMEKYLSIDPASTDMLEEKASLYQLRGRWEESLVIADGLLERNPEDANALDLKASGLLHLGRLKEAQVIADGLAARYPSDWPSVTALAGNTYYALGDYARAAQLAQKAAAQMNESELRDRVDGTVRLTLIASEARLGHGGRAKAALADFTTTLPQVTTIGAMKKWVHPSADLADFEPLYDGLRLAGVSN